MLLSFSLISQDRVVTETEVDEVLLPTANGQIGILPNHVDLVALLKTGEIITKSNGKTDSYAIFGGIAEVSAGTITVLADRAEHVDDIDLAKVEESKRQAEQMAAEAKDKIELSHAMGKLERNINRIRIAKVRKHHGSHLKTPESIQ